MSPCRPRRHGRGQQEALALVATHFPQYCQLVPGLDALCDALELQLVGQLYQQMHDLARAGFLGNAMRHARATQVRICVSGNASTLRLEVRDNGAGFEPASQSARPGHLGMIGMRERSIAIGARFEVDTRPGEGTSVVLSWQEREQ